jgi:glycosyltransferase involved in cell wall biosynthesis
MASCLLRAPEIEAVHFVVAPWQEHIVFESVLQLDSRFILHTSKMDRSSISRNAWYYRKLPRIANAMRADVAHLTHPMPINAEAFNCPVVVTLHDMYPFEIPMNFGFPKFIFNRIVLRQCLDAADAITCVSEATKSKLSSYLPSVSSKAIRVYNCVDPQLAAIDTRELKKWHNQPFLLCVAQHRRNKNLPLLIRAYKRLLTAGKIAATTQLLIVGISGPETHRIRRLIGSCALASRVHLREGLSEGELQWCYRNCEALVAPSITEGFGLPVAEAMLAGCRVVCSEILAHWEIGAGRCHFVEIQQQGEERLASAIAASLGEAKPRPLDLPDLSGAVIAREYVALYRKLIAGAAVVRGSAALPVAVSERQLL